MRPRHVFVDTGRPKTVRESDSAARPEVVILLGSGDDDRERAAVERASIGVGRDRSVYDLPLLDRDRNSALPRPRSIAAWPLSGIETNYTFFTGLRGEYVPGLLWGGWGSNPRPMDYESTALTD